MISAVALKILAPLLLAGVLAGSAYLYVQHVKAAERARVVAEYEAATAAEAERRREVLEAARAEAEQAAQRAAEMEAKNADLVAELAKRSAALNRVPCLAADWVRQLNAIGRPPR